jgi:hypothetical protein
VKHLPHLVTFPRSGSHYLDDIIYKEVQISIEKSHTVTNLFDKNNNKQRAIITIVRDPIDTIASYIALSEKEFGPSDSTRINQMMTEYILMYNFLNEHADYVLDFKDLIESPHIVVKKILGLLGITEQDYSLFSREYNTKHAQYVESSKTLNGYKRHNLEEFNMELCYFYYNKLLERKIIL